MKSVRSHDKWLPLALIAAAIVPLQGLSSDASTDEVVAFTDPLSAHSQDPFRQFDFWTGEWDVDLTALQPDSTWTTLTRARAHIYPTLGGRAVIELWDSEPIKGFSLRYFDRAAGEWVLWLNWPSENRSRVSRMTGQFHHGRGEFNSSFTNAEGIDTMMRYTFSDISSHSLRWDDRYSTDGGATWRDNWIMRFSRAAPQAFWPVDGRTPAPTYVDGTRCSSRQFTPLKALAGHYRGTYKRGGKRGAVIARVFSVVDGCALIVLADTGIDGEDNLLIYRTWNTDAEKYQDLVLSDDRDSGIRQYSSKSPDRLVDGRNAHRVNWQSDGELLQISMQTAISNGWAQKEYFELVRD